MRKRIFAMALSLAIMGICMGSVSALLGRPVWKNAPPVIEEKTVSTEVIKAAEPPAEQEHTEEPVPEAPIKTEEQVTPPVISEETSAPRHRDKEESELLLEENPGKDIDGRPLYADDSILVEFQRDFDGIVTEELAQAGITQLEELFSTEESVWYCATITGTVEDVIQSVRLLDQVQSAEFNHIYYLDPREWGDRSFADEDSLYEKSE